MGLDEEDLEEYAVALLVPKTGERTLEDYMKSVKLYINGVEYKNFTGIIVEITQKKPIPRIIINP